MRLNLYWRGRDVIDVELHIWRLRKAEPEPEQPKLQANGNAETERAEHFGDPDTLVSFGFGRPES